MATARIVFLAIQVIFIVLLGLYLLRVSRKRGSKKTVLKDSQKEMEKLQKMRKQGLQVPLAEKMRPQKFSEIVGQEEGLEALKAALCGPNPQHVILYGPPGTGKTAAARLMLKEAKKNPVSPFREDSRFIEVDGTTSRFDERGIADPLLGSVHDPIYQGAGSMGVAGIPQPKPGAVTKAHGGMLFIDEIGELHPVQMNKLLKVLEDRRVFLESSYYNEEDRNIPQYIHDVFQNGLPADFRLVGATTRLPGEIAPAIRSRCLEIFFRSLSMEEVGRIAKRAAKRIGVELSLEGQELIEKYATNGREAVNMLQLAAGMAAGSRVESRELDQVISTGQHNPRPPERMPMGGQVGAVAGLAVHGPNMGIIIEVEAFARAKEKNGELKITGVVEEEELGTGGHIRRRKSLAKNSLEIVVTLLSDLLKIDLDRYFIHINFPGGMPIDGPSAGATMACALYSAITGIPIKDRVALTGEVNLRGEVCGVGGISAKIQAARRGGAREVVIPRANFQEHMKSFSVKISPVSTLKEALGQVLSPKKKDPADPHLLPPPDQQIPGAF